MGLAKGVGAAVACTVVGTGAACVQVGRGIVNTPEAVSASVEGKEWDDRTHKWIHYNLAEETEMLAQMEATDYIRYIETEGDIGTKGVKDAAAAAMRGSNEATPEPSAPQRQVPPIAPPQIIAY